MKIHDVPQLSAMLRVSAMTVRSYLATGRLQGRKVGKRWLVSESALERFLMGSDNLRVLSFVSVSLTTKKNRLRELCQ